MHQSWSSEPHCRGRVGRKGKSRGRRGCCVEKMFMVPITVYAWAPCVRNQVLQHIATKLALPWLHAYKNVLRVIGFLLSPPTAYGEHKY